ncbi:Endo-1,4-beta-xylanase A precursor [compost metagenome]
MSFVPAVFATRNGKTVVTIKHNQNGRYTVVKLNRTFADLEGHWAKGDIELMSNKLVINGTGDGTFVPDQSITRAEFAVLISRALGLPTESVTGDFSDVSETDWYAGAVQAASEMGIIQGLGDGTFQPNALITREQAAAMILRAAAISGKAPAATGITLEQFSDSSSVSSWATHSIKQAVASGLIQGETSDRFAPKSKVNRAQTAVILKRLLVYMDFMNA